MQTGNQWGRHIPQPTSPTRRSSSSDTVWLLRLFCTLNLVEQISQRCQEITVNLSQRTLVRNVHSTRFSCVYLGTEARRPLKVKQQSSWDDHSRLLLLPFLPQGWDGGAVRASQMSRNNNFVGLMRTLTGGLRWCWEVFRPLNCYVAFSKQIKSCLIGLQRTQTGWKENFFEHFASTLLKKNVSRPCWSCQAQVFLRFLENVFEAPKCWNNEKEAGMSDDYLYLRLVFTSKAQKSTFRLKHPWDVCYDHRERPVLLKQWQMKNNIGNAAHLCFPFLFITQMQFIPLFDCFPIGAKKHTHSLWAA